MEVDESPKGVSEKRPTISGANGRGSRQNPDDLITDLHFGPLITHVPRADLIVQVPGNHYREGGITLVDVCDGVDEVG